VKPRTRRKAFVVLAVALAIGGLALVLSVMGKGGPSISRPRLLPADEPLPSRSFVHPPPDPAPSPEVPPSGEERACEGLVVTAGEGAPVPGARVVLRSGSLGELTITVTSDPDGRFRIGIPAAIPTPRLLFLHDRLAPLELPADFTREMRVELSEGVLVQGTVLAFGEETPVAGAHVIVRGPCTTSGRLLPMLARADDKASGATGFVNWRETRTDVNGRFVVEGIAGERFHVSAGKSGYAEIIAEKTLQPFDSRSGPIVIHLSPAWTYAIRVVDSESGEPVEGLAVREISRSTDRFGRAPLEEGRDFVQSSESGVYVARPFRIAGDHREGDRFSITIASDLYRTRSVEVVPVPYAEGEIRSPQVVEMDPLDAGLGGISILFLGLPSDCRGPLPLHVELARIDDEGIPFVEKHAPRVEGARLTLGAIAGKHRIRVWPYSLGGPLQRDVEVSEDRISEIEVRLDSCVLDVRAVDEEGDAIDGIEFHMESDSESGLHVSVSRTLREGDVVRLLLPAGTRRLSIRRDGYLPESLTPTLDPGRVNRIDLTMRRAP
jgi:hypothetical protein